MFEQSSARRKLTRGIEQVGTLRGEAHAFENREAYVLRTEEESRTATEVRYRCFIDERERPPDHWPLLAGEAIQNLRAALDHAIYSVSKGRASQYPIFTDECEFKVRGRPMLKGVPVAIRTLIEESQPYRILPNAPKLDALERLRSLSNIDKHRELNAVVGVVNVEWVGVPPGVTARWEKYGTNRVLGHGETHISTLIATVEDPSKAKIEDVDVNPGFAYQVRIERRPLDDLVPIYNRVFRAVGEVETGQPPPFGMYP